MFSQSNCAQLYGENKRLSVIPRTSNFGPAQENVLELGRSRTVETEHINVLFALRHAVAGPSPQLQHRVMFGPTMKMCWSLGPCRAVETAHINVLF